MSTRLVEEDAATTGSDDHGHLPGRCRAPIEHGHGHPGGSFGRPLRGEPFEQLSAGQAGRSVEPGGDHLVASGHRLDHQPDPRPLLLDPCAVRVRDEHPLEAIRVGHQHLPDRRVDASGSLVGLAEPPDLAISWDVVRGLGNRVANGAVPTEVERRAWRPGIAPGGPDRARRDAGRVPQRPGVEVVRERIGLAGSVDHPDAGAPIDPGHGLLHLAVVQPDRRRGPGLREDLREPPPGGQGDPEHLTNQLRVEHHGPPCGQALRATLPPDRRLGKGGHSTRGASHISRGFASGSPLPPASVHSAACLRRPGW